MNTLFPLGLDKPKHYNVEWRVCGRWHIAAYRSNLEHSTKLARFMYLLWGFPVRVRRRVDGVTLFSRRVAALTGTGAP